MIPASNPFHLREFWMMARFFQILVVFEQKALQTKHGGFSQC